MYAFHDIKYVMHICRTYVRRHSFLFLTCVTGTLDVLTAWNRVVHPRELRRHSSFHGTRNSILSTC